MGRSGSEQISSLWQRMIKRETMQRERDRDREKERGRGRSFCRVCWHILPALRTQRQDWKLQAMLGYILKSYLEK